MAKAKKVESLSLDQLLEYLGKQGVQAFKVNDSTIKLPYAWGSEIEVPVTEVAILNGRHTPMKIKA